MLIPDNDQKIEKLCEFVEIWAGSRRPDYGVKLEQIPEDIPKPLKEIYLFAGNWPNQRDNGDRNFAAGNQPRIFQEQDCLRGVESITRNGNRLAFAVENQGNWVCEVESNEIDPPVFCNAAEAYSEGDGFEIVCETLSHFLVTLCLQELVMSSKYIGTLLGETVSDICELGAEPIWLNGCYVFKEPTHDFYLAGNKLIIMRLYDAWWYACREESDLQFLKEPSAV